MSLKNLYAAALAAALTIGVGQVALAQTATTTETVETAEVVTDRDRGFDYGWLGLLGLLGLAGLSRRRDRAVPVHTDTVRTTVR